MSERPQVVLPAEAGVAVVGDTLTVRHDGDVVLGQTLGARAVRVDAGGDATLSGFRVVGSVRAGGRVVLHAPAEADEIRGEVVEIGDVEVTARAIVATRRVVVGRATLQVDVVSAPEVVLHAEASGRVRVLDCLHDVPATRLRGCLSVAEYDADFGDVREFLARRGVTPVGAPAAPVAAPPIAPPPDAETTAAPAPADPPPDDRLPVDLAPADPAPADPAPEAMAAPEAAPEPVPPVEPTAPLEIAPVEEAVDDVTDEPTVPPPARAPTRVAKAIERAVQRLEEAYPDGPPAAVAEAIELARRGRGDLLTLRIDALWVGTLRDHLARATPVPYGALLAFHTLRDARARTA